MWLCPQNLHHRPSQGDYVMLSYIAENMERETDGIHYFASLDILRTDIE